MEVHPIYLTIEDDDNFLSLIKKVAVEAQETLQHSEYVISKKGYDVFFNYRTAVFSEFHGSPARMMRIHSGHETDSLTINLHEEASTGNFILDFDFHCDVFDERQRSQTVQVYLKILDSFLEDRTQPIDRVDLLSDEEKHRILVRFNHKDMIFPEDQTITRLFEKQVEKAPAKIAAVSNDASLTFQELNEQADKLANLIRGLNNDSK
jgi:non-ribosomal peptide synthetase component F